MRYLFLCLALLTQPIVSRADNFSARPVLAGIDAIRAAGGLLLAQEPAIGVGYAWLTPAQESLLSQYTHEQGKCGGYERLAPTANAAMALAELKGRVANEAAAGLGMPLRVERDSRIEAALPQLSPTRLEETVRWLSSFPSRFHRLPDPNAHVRELEERARALLAGYPGSVTIERVSHRSTSQQSLRVRIAGRVRPSEIVVLGGHLDSINQSWGGGDTAPGADDNASGSANLLEALRVLAGQAVPERTIEFFWYAGEEAGLLGSGEIAEAYRAAGRDVVAVLQLDMTLFPGSGELVIGNVTDFTSAWLRGYLEKINELYLDARLVPDRCGYACSDHASWFRRGYPTLMPFESDTSSMNRAIHTTRDTISDRTSFRHSLVFAKIALVLAMDLGNSSERPSPTP